MIFNRFSRGWLMDPEPVSGGGGVPATPPAPGAAPPTAGAPVTAFDPAAFQTQIVAEFDKRVNALDKRFKGLDTGLTEFRTGIDAKFGEITNLLKPATPPVVEPPPKPSADVLALTRQVTELSEKLTKTERDAAETHKRSSLLSEISKHPLVTDTQNDFFSLIAGKVERGNDGVLYGPEGVTLADYVKAEYAKRPHLHPARAANGSGATASSPLPNARTIDLNNIKPGMSKEDMAATAAALLQLYPK